MATTRRPTRKPARPRPQRQQRGNVRALPERPRIQVIPESLEDFNESINWLIQGDSGVGKTVLASFAPQAIFLSTEKGVVAAQRVGSKARLLRAPDWEHVEASLDWADENLGLDDWMIIDSLSKMQILLIRWWLKIQNAENEARDIDVPQIQDHQKWQQMFMRFVDRIVDANYNTIFITTSMHKEDAEGDAMVLPAITGKDYAIANYVCAAMDIVSHLAVAPHSTKNGDDPTVRRLLNETYPPYFAKDRYNVLPRWTIIDEGKFDTIADLIRDIEEETTPDERRAAKADGR